MAPKKKSIPERFWPKVNKRPGTFGADGRYPTECWEWIGSLRPNGYGWFALGKRSEGTIGAHRMSWVLTHGEIRTGYNILHRCDNRQCVRPDHLFEGTQKQNIQDALQKDRRSTKLTENQVRAIRELVSNGLSHAKTAKQFGVSKSLVTQIVNHTKWQEVE